MLVYCREDIGNLSQGSYNMEFFSVEHNVGIQLSDDFILIGRDIPGDFEKVHI